MTEVDQELNISRWEGNHVFSSSFLFVVKYLHFLFALLKKQNRVAAELQAEEKRPPCQPNLFYIPRSSVRTVNSCYIVSDTAIVSRTTNSIVLP
jgi:hypothetical protein